jgi:hypothetical protein
MVVGRGLLSVKARGLVARVTRSTLALAGVECGLHYRTCGKDCWRTLFLGSGLSPVRTSTLFVWHWLAARHDLAQQAAASLPAVRWLSISDAHMGVVQWSCRKGDYVITSPLRQVYHLCWGSCGEPSVNVALCHSIQ